MEYRKEELVQMLEAVRQQLAEQGMYVDDRLLSRETRLEQFIKNLEVKQNQTTT